MQSINPDPNKWKAGDDSIKAYLISAYTCGNSGGTDNGTRPGAVPVRLIQRAD